MKARTTLSAIAALLLALLPGCSSDDDPGDGGDPTTPTVLSSAPADGAGDAPLNVSVSATFSEAMDADTLAGSTFTLTTGAGVQVPGTVIYADSTAVFWPAAHLAADGSFTATITTEALSASGVALGETHSWSFGTGDALAPGIGVDLRSAGDYVILAKSAISTVPPAAIAGDLGVSPAAASYITGFSLTADATNVFSTSPQVEGKVYAADYAVPTPSQLTTAVSDMELAFTDAAGRAPGETELGAGDIGGMTLEAGVYKWSSGLTIPTDVTLNGSATDVWIFQIAQDMTMASGTSIILSGGALAENVYWQVSGKVVLGTAAHLEGAVLSQTSVTLNAGASATGRLLAQTAVSVSSSTVVDPAR